MTPRYGIIGFPLSHSSSPAWFNSMFKREGIDAWYDAFPLADISMFPELLRQYPALRGLSVTIPYKEKILQFLHEVDAAAAEVGAVNCIKIAYGELKGYNTDIIGFRDSLTRMLTPAQDHALILGNGGAARAVRNVLCQLSIPFITVSRKAESGLAGQSMYDSLTKEIIAANRLIINTTPLGMYPNVDSYPPIPYDGVGPGHLMYDLVYYPELTGFLAEGQARGAAIKNGLEMLELQAMAAWKLWSGE